MISNEVREYNLSLAHADAAANLQDIILLDRELRIIYEKHPDVFAHIDNSQRILARLVLRTNHQQEHLRQEIVNDELLARGSVDLGDRKRRGVGETVRQG